MMATGAWMAFLSVLAIIGIIVAGGFIVALLGRMVLSLVSPKQYDEVQKVDEFGYVNNMQGGYITQNEEMQRQVATEYVPQAQTNPSDDYSYAVDVDDELAKAEEDALNKALDTSDDDDFFNDFVGDDDVRFNADDLMGMVDEISQDILDEEQQTVIETEQAESEANKSMLDQYSIDDYLNQEDLDEEFDEVEPEIENEKQITEIVDEQTMEEINALKQQVKEIVDSMEENKNQNETFNEQLINILNELKEANKKEVRTEEDAEREINELKQQLEDSRIEMEQQLQAKIADKDAEMQERLQEQLEASNAEIESLKAQLSELISKMEQPQEDEEPEALETEPEEVDEITSLREEVKNMINEMREESNAKNDEFNTQLLEILNEMKQATLSKSEQLKVETNEDAIEQVNDWQDEVEIAEKELNEQFKEEMLHKTEAEKAEIRAQMESYNEEIGELKAQLATLMEQFKTESENAKNENQALLDQLEAERQERIKLEQEKLEAEIQQQAQLESLRKENEELIDRIQAKETITETLTQEEMDDLYSEVNTIDYSAISKMNDEQIQQKVNAGLEDSKQQIDELKEQISRLTDYIKEREDSLAEKLSVHEVRSADFDVETIKEITAQEVEQKVKEKIVSYLAEIELLKDELSETKQQVEAQYKQQLADTDAGMEYDRVSKLQDSAEKIDSLNEKLAQLSDDLKEENENAQATSEECVAELESVREEKSENAKIEDLSDADVSVVGPKNNQVALVANDEVQSQEIEKIDIETVMQLTEAEIDEIVEKRLQASNIEIEKLKQEIENLKQGLVEGVEQAEDGTTVPVVRSPLFDVELIKTITAQEVEKKVQERLAEAMKEIEAMKEQLELSKQEIERQYKAEVANVGTAESEVKDKLKDSAAEVIELKENLIDLTDQIALEHMEAKQNSEIIAEQLGQDRKEKEELARQQLAIAENSLVDGEVAEVTVIGPKNNQVALVTNVTMLTEEVGEINEDIPTIDIETVKELTEQEIEEKVQIRMASSTIEIEELKKQILNLSLQIKEIKGQPTDDEDDKPMVFHYATEEAYLERLAILDERLKNAKKDLKINNKELNPLEKVRRTLERDKAKLRRKYAIVAKKKVALYGVNNYVDIDKEKAEKLAQEIELLEGLKLSVAHCEEVMNANVDRYPILVHTDKILKENIANIEADMANLNKELNALREKNGANND